MPAWARRRWPAPPFPIDRDQTAEALGFDRPAANSIDAVSDRDFALEFLAALADRGGHLSRFAEEIVIWMSEPYRFIRLSDAFTTGSSIMPQKRNPDAAELVRAKTGRLIGALAALLTVMKGLPLAYAKDMQEDKAPVFDAADTLALALAAIAGMVRDLAVDAAAMRRVAASGYSTATDLADWLVRALGLPFREAHHITGALVKRAEALGVDLAGLPLAGDAEDRAAHHRRGATVLTVEQLGGEPDELRRHCARERRRAAAAARKRFLAKETVMATPAAPCPLPGRCSLSPGCWRAPRRSPAAARIGARSAARREEHLSAHLPP